MEIATEDDTQTGAGDDEVSPILIEMESIGARDFIFGEEGAQEFDLAAPLGQKDAPKMN